VNSFFALLSAYR